MTPFDFPGQAQPGRRANLIESSSRIERLLGKRPVNWTEHDLASVYATLELRQVSLMHCGGDGQLKTLDFAPRDHRHFLNILRYGERADGSSLFPGLGIPTGASDIVLVPRLETAFVDPFSSEGSLAVLCSHATRDGRPLPQSGDTIVRHAHGLFAKQMGFELHALGEVEYFVGHTSLRKREPTGNERGYHATAPLVFAQELRRRALTILAEMGIPVKYAHSEVGFAEAENEGGLTWEQHEIELALQPLPAAAEAVSVAQWVLRNLASEYGMTLSFDPIVKRGHAGSGMHFHMAAYREQQYLPVMDGDEAVSGSAELMIAGLLKHGCSLMAFGNRKENSFVRLFQGKESPGSVTWGRFNRKALVRLPIIAKDENGNPVTTETVEFRLPDGSAAPHLLLAGVAQAIRACAAAGGSESLLSDLRAEAKTTGARQEIPRNAQDVGALLKTDRAIYEADGVFPTTFIDAEIARLCAEH